MDIGGCNVPKENIKKTYKSGRTLEVHKTYSHRYGIPPKKKGEKRNPTPETMRRKRQELKYITVTEHKTTAIHHHLILNAFDLREVLHLWPHGKIRPTYLDNIGEYSSLAWYLIKETRKTFNRPDRLYGKRWNPSKNIVTPEAKVQVVKAEEWQEPPQPVKGYSSEVVFL